MRRIVMAVLLATAAACAGRGAPTAPAPTSSTLAIMGPSRLSAAQLVAWFNGRQPRPAGTYSAGVPLDALAGYYIQEGSDEGVTGDVAFVQSIIETGWFRFGGIVPPSANNFAGIGAVDGGTSYATFPDARTGVRAQIQHLRAYADPTALTCASPPLRHPCVDPRFHLVSPKGKAPTWNQLGSGNWATAPGYGASIVALYQEALQFGTR